MPSLRKILPTIAIVLFAAFSFISIEWHADHDAAASAVSDECCVQCCPAHNLAPMPAVDTSTSVNEPVERAFPETPSLYQDPYLDLFDPPPISVLV